jgi:outer membrane receptor protein involved in Fe transport
VPTLFAAAIACLSASLAAQAQQAPEQPAQPPSGEQAGKVQQVEVRGSSEAYDPRRDDTASKIVVNHDEIVKYGDTSVLDVLKRVPGVTVSGAGGRGGEIRMRGLGGGYTQVLINGERAPAGFDIDSLAPDVIERIEVLRAASAEFSTQSIAGTINIVLKKAVKAAQRELKLGYGKGNALKSPTANLQLSDSIRSRWYSASRPRARRKAWNTRFRWAGMPASRSATTAASSATPICRAARRSTATRASTPRSRGWRCMARMNGMSRRCGRSTPACAGKASTPAATAIPSTPCSSVPACSAR